jgi:hypothetical protein
VINALVIVILKSARRRSVELSIVGVDAVGIDRNVTFDFVHDLLHGGFRHVIGACLAVALNNPEDRLFVPALALAPLVKFAADVGLPCFKRSL